MDPNPSELVENNNVAAEIECSGTQPIIKRRRKKKSMVWDHFTTETSTSGTTKAFCNHCKKSYAYVSGGKASGTSHLKRHIELGICDKCPQTNKDVTTTTTPPKKQQKRYASNVALDQDRCNHEMAKMIIMHDYPLHMVEHPGFACFVEALRPQFIMPRFDTIHGDCVGMFLSEKHKLSEFIGEIPGGVNLTVDLWSSVGCYYAFVTGHFVDKDWNLSHYLLNVSVVSSPDSDFALNQSIAACLSEWKLEGRVSSITVSESLVSKTCVDNLRGYLSFRNQHVLNGQLLMGKCYARLLTSMAQDLLAAEQFQGTIKKVRDSVKCVMTNDACGEKFDDVKRLFPTDVSYKDLMLDNQGRWDTSYKMLLAGYEHRQVFSCLETCYPGYKISISPEEWGKIESLCSCLKVLFEASDVLTSRRKNHLTANNFYDVMTKLQLELSHMAMGEDEEGLGNSLRERFDLYWRGCFLVVAVAVVMDPRFKMQHIKDTFTELYGEDAEQWIKTVSDAVHDLYLNYNLLDSYVDHGFPDTEEVVQEEVHFRQDMPQDDTNTGNGQSGDETRPQSEQTTEAHQNETQTKVVDGVSEKCQAHPLAEEEDQTLFMGDELLEEGSTLVTEVAQEPHFQQDKPQDANTGDETSPQSEQTTEAHQNETQPKVVDGVSEEFQAHPLAEEPKMVDGVSEECQTHPLAEEPKVVDGASEECQTHPVAEEPKLVGVSEECQTHQNETPPKVVDGVSEECQTHPVAEEPKVVDGVSEECQAHPVAEEEEEQTLFMGDELLEEGSTLVTVGESFSDFDIDIPEMKPELEQYLDDNLVLNSEDFDVLAWWRLNSTNYPILSKMAADLLSIPFSTVSPDSVFDTQVKQMDHYRNSLPRGTLEALLCTKDWLQKPNNM